MVQVIRGLAADHHSYGGGAPLIHIHHIKRDVFGNGIAITVKGELKIAAKEIIFARELKLNTLQEIQLTIETGSHWMYTAQKNIHSKGEYDNYASIDILAVATAPYEGLDSGLTVVGRTRPSYLPSDASIWLNFEALGE